MTKVSDTIYKLTVKGVQVDDAGVYKVVATNDWGTVGSEAKVAVERKNNFHKLLLRKSYTSIFFSRG